MWRVADLQNALEKALFERLSAQLPGVTVAQHVDQDAPAPLVIIGEIVLTEVGAKATRLTRAEVDIVTEVHATQRKPLNTLQSRVHAALDAWRPAATAQAQFGVMTSLTTVGAMGADAASYFGSQRFQIMVQAA
jgi:hypothetical protein